MLSLLWPKGGQKKYLLLRGFVEEETVDCWAVWGVQRRLRESLDSPGLLRGFVEEETGTAELLESSGTST